MLSWFKNMVGKISFQFRKENSPTNKAKAYIKAGRDITAGGDIVINNQSVSIDKHNQALTPEAIDIINEAKKRDGIIYVLSITEIPSGFVRVGSKDYYDQNDPKIAASYRDSLNELIDLGYVVHESKQLYRLTKKGWNYKG